MAIAAEKANNFTRLLRDMQIAHGTKWLSDEQRWERWIISLVGTTGDCAPGITERIRRREVQIWTEYLEYVGEPVPEWLR